MSSEFEQRVPGAETVRIRVATVTCESAGWEPAWGQQDVDRVVAVVEGLGPAPHVLALTGMINVRSYTDDPLQALTRQLTTLLPEGDRYYPFIVWPPDEPHPRGLWLSARRVPPAAHQPPRFDWPPPMLVGPHTLSVVIAGTRTSLQPVSWSHVPGPPGSGAQALLNSGLAAMPTILLGDFTTPAGERHVGRVLHAGFWQAAADRRGATRILVSQPTPARLLPDSTRHDPDIGESDPIGVACDLEFTASPALASR